MPSAQQIIGFLKGPHVGSVLAMVGAIWNGVLFVGPAFGIGESDQWAYAGYVFTGTVVSAGYTVFRLTAENWRLKRRLTPRVHVIHQQGKNPYYVREADMGNGAIERRHMIGIVNDSDARIERIRVMPERFEPYMQGATWIDRPLHTLGAPSSGEGWFDLSVGDGGPTRYVEILREVRGVKGMTDSLSSYVYDSANINALNRHLIGDWFAVVLRVEGDMRPCRFKIVARRNALGWMEVYGGDIDVPTMSNAAPANYRMVTLGRDNLARLQITG